MTGMRRSITEPWNRISIRLAGCKDLSERRFVFRGFGILCDSCVTVGVLYCTQKEVKKRKDKKIY